MQLHFWREESTMRTPRRTLPVVFAFALSLALATAAAAKRPITFDDLISFGRVGDPQISPDGKWVAYTVDRYDKAANTRSSAIWLASLETGENRQLTRTDKRDSRPRWAPNSKSLAFLSNRAGSWQLWTIRLDGGEATQLTKLPVDISAHTGRATAAGCSSSPTFTPTVTTRPSPARRSSAPPSAMRKKKRARSRPCSTTG
jgi:hypothetical protein